MVSTRTCSVIALVYLLLASGCATKIPITMLKPGNYHQAATAKTIAVLPFSGTEGESFAVEIESILANVEVNGKPYFTLVDRGRIDGVLSELKFQSALVDPAKAAKAGQILGAQGIYTGAASAKTQATSYRETRSECAEHEMKTDKKGNKIEGKCIRWNKHYVRCHKRVSTFSATPKLTAVSTGKVLYTRTITRQEQSSGCDDKKPPQDESELMEKAKTFVKGEFRKDVAPYYETVTVALLDSADGIDSPEAKNFLASGIDLAKKNQLTQACDLWKQARSSASGSVSLAYNTAICAEADADFAAALKLYKEAQRLNGKPDENIALGLSRAAKAFENQKKLDEQLATE